MRTAETQSDKSSITNAIMRCVMLFTDIKFYKKTRACSLLVLEQQSIAFSEVQSLDYHELYKIGDLDL